MADQQQLDIETAINKAIQARSALLERNRQELANQVAIAQELCRAMECKELDGYNDRISETREGLLKASEASDKASESTQNMGASMKKAEKKAFSFKGAAVGAALAVKSVFGKAAKVIKSIGGILVGLVKGGFNLVRGVMAAYTGMLGEMAKRSKQASDNSLALRNSFEALKGQFGDLATGVGKQVVNTFKEFRSQAGNLAGTGLRLSKVFGRGPEGLANMNKFLADQFESLGDGLDRFAAEMAEGAEEAFLLNKALGFTGEDFENLAIMAGHAGETLKETMGRLSREVVTVSKRFGVNSRVMAKNISIMMKSPGVFGMNTKELIKTSAAAQKLGMSIEALKAPMGVFDDFEKGAVAAADLAAHFGIFVDNAALMTMEPAEQTMALKDALAKSGKEFGEMTRQERSLLAETMNMTDKQLAQMMDPSNTFDGDAYNAMDKGVDAATKNTMAQTAATRELTKAIEQMNEAGLEIDYDRGFFGAFRHGISEGLMNSPQFLRMMGDIRAGFDAMYHSGFRVGKYMGKLFDSGGPLSFISEHFAEVGANAEAMAEKVEKAFKDFVDNLMDPGKQTEALKILFEDLFGVIDGPNGTGKLFSGFMELFDLIGANILNAAPMLMEKMIGLFETLTAMMTGQSKEIGKGLGDDVMFPMMSEAFAKLKDDGVLDRFGEAFMDMMSAFWDKFGPTIEKALGVILAGIIGAAFVQSIPLILAGGLLKGAMQALGGAASGLLGKASAATGGTVGPDGSTTYNIPKKGVIDQFADMIKAFGKMELSEIGKAALTITAIGAGLAAALYLMSKGIKKIAETGASPLMVTAVAGLVLATAGVMNAVQKMIDGSKAGSKITMSVAGKMAIALAAAVLITGGVALLMVSIVKDFAGIKINPGFAAVVDGAGQITMTVLKATAAIVGLGAIIGLIAMIPGGGLVLAAAIAAAGTVMFATSELILTLVKRFANIPLNRSKKANKAVEAAGKIVETVMLTLDQMDRIIAINAVDPNAFDTALEDMGALVDSVAKRMLPAVSQAAAMITEDPTVIKEKMSILIQLLDGFAPIANLYAAAMSLKDMKPEQVAGVVNHISKGIASTLQEMGSFVTGIVSTVGDLDAAQIESAKAAGPMISALASLMSSIPFDQIKELTSDDVMKYQEQVLHEENYLMADELKTVERTKVLKRASVKQREFINVMVDMVKAMGPALKSLVETMMTVDMGPDPARMGRKMEAMSKVFVALDNAGKVLKSFSGSALNDNKKLKRTARQLGMLFVEGSYGEGVLTSINPALEELARFSRLSTTKRSVAGIDDLTEIFNHLPQLFRSGGAINDGLAEAFPATAEKALESLRAVKGKFTSAAVRPLIEMIKAFNEIDTELSSAKNIVQIDTVLKKVADALKVSEDEVTVKRGNVNVTVKLNVVMKADDLTEVMVKGEFLGTQALGEKGRETLELD